MAFPGAAAYALLVLTNLVYNNFGADSGGIQFFYASPVQFRQIVLGKNLAYAAIVVVNTVLAWVAVRYLYGAPHLAVTVATMAGLLFAAPLNFSAGNLLSLYSPKKRDFSAFGRQNATQMTVLASFGIADAIIELVKNADGPVTLLQVDREVRGFATNTLPAWYFGIPRPVGDVFVWGGMTEAGEAALRKIIYGKKVAVQFVTPLPYLLDGPTPYLDRDDWQPIMLLPPHAANMSKPDLLVRLSPRCLEDALAGPSSGKKVDLCLLTPGPMRFSADYFSVGDPRNHFFALVTREPPTNSSSN